MSTTRFPPPSTARPNKPSLKVTTANPSLQRSTGFKSYGSGSRGMTRLAKLSPIPLPPQDLCSLVAASIRARPSPRRNQPDFYFCSTESQPVAPPPTPVHSEPASEDEDDGEDDGEDDSASSQAYTPLSEGMKHVSFAVGPVH